MKDDAPDDDELQYMAEMARIPSVAASSLTISKALHADVGVHVSLPSPHTAPPRPLPTGR